MKRIWLMGDYSQAEIRVAAWKGPIPSMKSWFLNNEDIHLNVAKLIGRVVETHHIKLPRNLWGRKPWQELSNEDKEDHDNERDLAKRTVHANTNGMGPIQFSIICGLPRREAETLQNMYHALFPELRHNYHRGIREQLQKDRTLTNPLGWKRTFYGLYGPDLEREAYAWYPQSTIGLLTIGTWSRVCEAFAKELPEAKLYTPENIRGMGYDAQLQVHDSIGISLPNSPNLVRDAAKQIKKLAERPLLINNEELIIPFDFKIGENWGSLKTYHVD